MRERTSDRGWTFLRGGVKARKDHPRLAVCGDLDELDSLLGAVLAVLAKGRAWEDARRPLQEAQSALLAAGCALADRAGGGRMEAARLGAATRALESGLESLGRGLPPLRGFVVPGGSRAGAWLHVARAVCRRAERGAVALSRRQPPPDGLLAFLNRLSAFLFVAARWANAKQGRPESVWSGRRRGAKMV